MFGESFPQSVSAWDYADMIVVRTASGRARARSIGIIRTSAFCDLCRHRHKSHFRRNLLSAHELATTTSAKRFCRKALTLQRQLFRLWYRFRADPHVRGAPLTRAQLITKVRPIERRFFALAERHVNAADADVSNLARALFVHHPHFFTFVHEEGVEPTNNAANAARGIGDRMPRAGLCRVAVNRTLLLRADLSFAVGNGSA